MTILEFVRQYFPEVKGHAEARDLLWGATSYPFGSYEVVVEQMEEMSKASESDVERAIAIAHERTDKIMQELRERGER
jgi:hypothetical protein